MVSTKWTLWTIRQAKETWPVYKLNGDHLNDGLSPQYKRKMILWDEDRIYAYIFITFVQKNKKIEFMHILVSGKLNTLVRNRSWKVLPFSFSFASFKELEQRNKYQIGKVYKDNRDTVNILARKNYNRSLYEQLKWNMYQCQVKLSLLHYPD